jgi:hypothetical protein
LGHHSIVGGCSASQSSRALSRRIADLAGGGVESDQVARERDELIAMGRDVVAYGPLAVGERHGAKPNSE